MSLNRPRSLAENMKQLTQKLRENREVKIYIFPQQKVVRPFFISEQKGLLCVITRR